MKKTTVESKSLGIPLTEDIAREVDSLIKKLPKDCTYRRKGAVPEAAELVSGERASIALVSTENLDRDGDVVLAKGMQLDMFQRNPIVTFAHKYDALPVGKCQWIKKVQGGLRAKTVYTDAHELARAVWQMTQELILRGFSIGFLPTKIRSATKDEVARNPTWKDAGAIIESAVLLEYAVAPIPVNQDALLEAVSKGKTDAKTLALLGLSYPQQRKLSMSEVAEILEREFTRAAGEYTPEKIRERLLEKYKA